MGLGWFGLSTFWLLPLAWRTATRALAGDRRPFGRGSLRVWLGTLLVLGASATLESLTAAEGEGAGGAVGHALAGLASNLLGWTGALLMMLAVLGLAAPMVFGETWRSLFLLRKPRAQDDAPRQPARPAARPESRTDAGAFAGVAASPSLAAGREGLDRWETTSLPTHSAAGWSPTPPRTKQIEAVSARKQPAWQPPPRTRQSPPQPGEIWLHHADSPGAVKAAPAKPAAVVPPQAAKPAPARQPARAAVPNPVPTPVPNPTPNPAPTPAPQKPVAPRATVVSSPFRNPALGLRSAITTLPEAAQAATVAVSAATSDVAVMEPPAVTATTAIEAKVVARAEAIVNGIDDLAVVDAVDTMAAPAPAAVPATPDAPVTLAAIRQEAMDLLAELRALAGRAGQEAAPVAVAETPVAEPEAVEEPVAEVLAEPEAAPEPIVAAEPEPEPDPEPTFSVADAVASADFVIEAPTPSPAAAEASDDDASDDTGEENTPAFDANTLVQPAPKPRIVLPAVVGRTVPLTPAVAPSAPAAPVATPAPVTPPPPPRIVDYRLPDAGLLESAVESGEEVSEAHLRETGELIAQRLAEFKVPVSVVGASAGPVITRFEVDPAMGVRGAQVVGLMKDLARALGVTSIRVVETIPGKTCMGLELPNAKRQMIRLSEIVAGAAFQSHASRLVLAMGKDITGNPVVTDLARAPHLLVAGTTGSGKSVAVNAMILSMLYKATPEDVRLIMIDPKMLELSVYEGIPHLLAPVVTDMKQAAHALNWCVGEMEKRYRLMSALGVRNLAGYNQKIRAAEAAGEKVRNPFSLTPDAPEPLSTLPLIVVVIDELADLMMVAGKKIEELIARLAQKARAAGIHLILATQRPSVDVITGLIKANIPTRVAFQVSSKIDSRTILDQMGAESLLGQGDMLFLPPGTGYPQRVHGAFVADDEVHRVVEHWKQFGEPDYDEAILAGDTPEGATDLFGESGGEGESDPLYDEAASFVLNSRRASISAVQRQLRIGYNRAARLIEQMEAAGLVSPMGRNGTREVLAPGGPE